VEVLVEGVGHIFDGFVDTSFGEDGALRLSHDGGYEVAEFEGPVTGKDSVECGSD
jgi:hypothetical protein